MNPVARTAANDERRRDVSWNGRVAIASEGSRSWINQAHEVRSRRNAGKRVRRFIIRFVEVVKEQSCGRSQFRPCGESNDPYLVGIDVPVLGVRSHQPYGLERVMHRVGLHVIAVAPQAVAQDDRVDPETAKPGNKISAL